MAVGFLNLSNLTVADLAHGIPLSTMPGDRGVVDSFILIISINGLTPGTPCMVAITAPTTATVSDSGPADDFGTLSISVSWQRSSGDTNWNQAGHGAGVFPDGFWNLIATGVISPGDQGYGAIDIQFGDTDVIGFSEDLTDVPDNPQNEEPSWDGEQGSVLLEVDYDNSDNEDPDSIAIVRNGVAIVNIPWVDGITSYSFTDTVFEEGDYDYEFFVYKYPNSKSGSTSPISVSFGGVPSITMTMSGGITFGGSATMVFLGNPTGTYTLITNKTNDTLYNTEDNVAIPNPFADTGFLP